MDRRSSEREDPVHSLTFASSADDRVIPKQSILVREYKVTVATFGIAMLGILHEPRPNLDAQPLRELCDRWPERPVIGDQQQRSSATNPRLDRGGLGLRIGGTVFGVVRPPRERNDQNRDSLELLSAQCLLRHPKSIAVVAQQIGQWLVPGPSRVRIPMALTKSTVGPPAR